jgi:hypothetical protein
MRRAAEIIRLEVLAEAAATGAPRRAPEHVTQNVLEAATAETSPAATTGGTPLKTVRAPGEAFEVAVAVAREAAPRLRAVPFEAAKARLALGVDLAAVEGLALILVADDLVGGVELGKARRRLRLFTSPALALLETPNTS